jgi:hypothetical protein
MSSINDIADLYKQIKTSETAGTLLSEASFEIGPGHKKAQKTQKIYNKAKEGAGTEKDWLKKTGPQLPLAKAKPEMQVAGYEPEGDVVDEATGISKAGALQALHNHKYSKQELWDMQKKATDRGDHGMASALYSKWKEMKEELISEREMTKAEMKKEKRLKDKYDTSAMKKSMIDQYGKEKGTQIYFATIRKQAMADSFELDGEQLDEFLGTGRVVAARSQAGANPAGGSRHTQVGTVQKVFGVKVPGSFKPGASQSDVARHNQRASASSQIKPEKQSMSQLLGRTPGGQTTSGITADKKPAAPAPKPAAKPTFADKGREMRRQLDAKNAAIQSLRQSFDYDDAYDYIIEMLVAADFAVDYEAAEVMFEHISDEFTATILEEYIEEKARGTRKKTTVHAYDVDETLFGHGKKGKPNVQVHVKDASGKRVKSLSNQEFNTHKLDKGHSYDFSEFQSAKKFKETSSPNKKVIKDIKRKQARGQNVHLITARSKFDKPSEFQGHLKKHGVDVDKSKIHYTGGMKGGDIGKKKVDVANAVAKQSGAKKIHMYDDAAKVHKAFEKEKKEAPTTKKIKTHMVAPDKKGESRVRSYQATKNEEMTAYDYWKQFID